MNRRPPRVGLALLARSGISLLRTDRAGTITTDGKWREIATYRQAAGGREVENKAARSKGADKPPARVTLLNVNIATLAELESLPGIGPVLARRIVEARPFRSVEALARVKGIGPRRVEEVRRLVRAE